MLLDAKQTNTRLKTMMKKRTQQLLSQIFLKRNVSAVSKRAMISLSAQETLI
jgi:hypothetical protein